MNFEKDIKAITFGTAIASLLLCSPLYPSQHAKLKEDSVSMKIIKDTLAKNPKSKIARISCASVFIKHGNYEEAEKLLIEVLEEDTTNKVANKMIKQLGEVYKVSYTPKPQIVIAEDSEKKVTPKPAREPNISVTDEKSLKITDTKRDSKVKNEVKSKKASRPVEKATVKIETNESQLSHSKKTLPTKDEVLKKARDPHLKERLPSKEEILKKAKEKKEAEKAKEPLPTKDEVLKKARDPHSKERLPSKEEILKKAKERKEAEKAKEPLPTKDEILEKARVSHSKERLPSKEEILKKAKEKVETKEVVEQPNEDVEETIDNMVFTPYISPMARATDGRKSLTLQSSNSLPPNDEPIYSESTPKDNSIISNTKKSAFLKSVADSFSINLDEALCKVENNQLDEAKNYLNKAAILAVASKEGKKIYDVQLSKAVLLLYQCEFEKYGKHIMSLRKGISDEVYNSLLKIYENAISLSSQDEKLRYVANVAYDSSHFKVALTVLKKLSAPTDADKSLIKQLEELLSKLDGEYLLNQGSYMSAIDFFEIRNDNAEKGRTYLAISKSLEEVGDIEEAKIAEIFGRSSLFNCISDDPNNPQANLYLALYFLDKGDRVQAKEAIRRGLSSNSTNELVNSKLLNLSENL